MRFALAYDTPVTLKLFHSSRIHIIDIIIRIDRTSGLLTENKVIQFLSSSKGFLYIDNYCNLISKKASYSLFIS